VRAGRFSQVIAILLVFVVAVAFAAVVAAAVGLAPPSAAALRRAHPRATVASRSTLGPNRTKSARWPSFAAADRR